MKKILIGVAIPTTLAIIFGAAPYYLGKKAQQSLDIQYRALADTFFFDVVSHDYERGWFTSTETTVVRFHPTFLAKINKQLPDNIRILFDKPVTIVNHVKHGFFADGLKPVRAVVNTEFQYDPEVKKVLSRFFGNQTPIYAHNTIQLNGSGTLTAQIASFDYEELSGIKLNWQGMTANVQYQNGFTEYSSHFNIPSLKAQLADQGSISVEHIDVKTQSQEGQDITLGSSESSLGRFEIFWNQNIPYNIRLNDLVNMVTDLQIGAFINPNGNITPNKIIIDQMNYRTQTNQTNDGFINSRGIFSFHQLEYGTDQYGPLNINVSAEHLHGKSLANLKKRWSQIATLQQSEEHSQNLALEAVRKEGIGIFTHNPIFKIEQFDFTTPNGHISVNGIFKLNNLIDSDLNDFSSVLRKIYADINFNISQTLLESFAITQARSLFTVEDPNDAQEQQEIDDTIRMLTAETINNMYDNGYIQKENGAITTRFTLENSHIALNSKPFETQSDEDLFAQLEAEVEDNTSSAPALTTP